MKTSTAKEVLTTDENANVSKSAGMKNGKHFKIMSWNIDGLDNGSREARTVGVVEKIKK
jgi:hypothetical protein